MKVLLIEPLKLIWEMMRPCIPVPLGLVQLAAVLEEQKIDVKIIDCTALNIGRRVLAEVIREEQPAIVGATALTPFLYKAVEVAEVAKDVDRRIITVLGGPHVTYLPEETLKENAAIDIVACGEGERVMTDLVLGDCCSDCPANQALWQQHGLDLSSKGEAPTRAYYRSSAFSFLRDIDIGLSRRA
jgi:hypothetical protein